MTQLKDLIHSKALAKLGKDSLQSLNSTLNGIELEQTAKLALVRTFLNDVIPAEAESAELRNFFFDHSTFLSKGKTHFQVKTNFYDFKARRQVRQLNNEYQDFKDDIVIEMSFLVSYLFENKHFEELKSLLDQCPAKFRASLLWNSDNFNYSGSVLGVWSAPGVWSALEAKTFNDFVVFLKKNNISIQDYFYQDCDQKAVKGWVRGIYQKFIESSYDASHLDSNGIPSAHNQLLKSNTKKNLDYLAGQHKPDMNVVHYSILTALLDQLMNAIQQGNVELSKSLNRQLKSYNRDHIICDAQNTDSNMPLWLLKLIVYNRNYCISVDQPYQKITKMLFTSDPKIFAQRFTNMERTLSAIWPWQKFNLNGMFASMTRYTNDINKFNAATFDIVREEYGVLYAKNYTILHSMGMLLGIVALISFISLYGCLFTALPWSVILIPFVAMLVSGFLSGAIMYGLYGVANPRADNELVSHYNNMKKSGGTETKIKANSYQSSSDFEESKKTVPVTPKGQSDDLEATDIDTIKKQY